MTATVGDNAKNRNTRHVNKAGAHSRAVGANLRRLRKARSISTHQLANMLAEKGRHIQASSLSRLEAGERRADIDDVVVLAIILGVSPTALMLPFTAEGNVEIEGLGEVPARAAWAWADGRAPLADPAADNYEETYVDHQMHSRPRGLRMFVRPNPDGGWLAYTPWEHDQGHTGPLVDWSTSGDLVNGWADQRSTG